MPYPGEFLGPDLEERIIKTCELLISIYASSGNEQGVLECGAIIEPAEENPFRAFDTRAWLEERSKNWWELTARAEGIGLPA